MWLASTKSSFRADTCKRLASNHNRRARLNIFDMHACCLDQQLLQRCTQRRDMCTPLMDCTFLPDCGRRFRHRPTGRCMWCDAAETVGSKSWFLSPCRCVSNSQEDLSAYQQLHLAVVQPTINPCKHRRTVLAFPGGAGSTARVVKATKVSRARERVNKLLYGC